MKINDQKLSNLRFADDTTIISENENDLKIMIEDLMRESEKTGLLLNWKKTKILTNVKINNVNVRNNIIEVVDKFKYLGTKMSFENREDNELTARVSSAWKAFWNYKRFFTNKKLALIHKRRLLNMCILPVFTYGSAVWSLTDHRAHRLSVEQRAMERIMMNTSRIAKIRNEKL